MNPNSPLPAPPPMMPTTPTGYEFLNAPQKKPIKLLPGGSSKKGRIILVSAGAALLLVLVMILVAVLGGSGDAYKKDLLTAAQQQQELIRVSTIGVQKARDNTARNRAITVQLTLESDQVQLLAISKTAGLKLTTKELALGKNAKTDLLLTQAEQANRFDDAFSDELFSELAAYQGTLKKIHDATSKKASKDKLAQQFNHVTLLAPPKK